VSAAATALVVPGLVVPGLGSPSELASPAALLVLFVGAFALAVYASTRGPRGPRGPRR
jgi:hypothetical protein